MHDMACVDAWYGIGFGAWYATSFSAWLMHGMVQVLVHGMVQVLVRVWNTLVRWLDWSEPTPCTKT
jgi:hypothetical protein